MDILINISFYARQKKESQFVNHTSECSFVGEQFFSWLALACSGDRNPVINWRTSLVGEIQGKISHTN